MKIVKKESKIIELNCVCGHVSKEEEYKLHEYYLSGDDWLIYRVVGSECEDCLENVAVFAEMVR